MYIVVTAVLFFVCIVLVIGSVYWWLRSSRTAPAPVVAAKPNGAVANWSSATFSVHAADGLYQTSEKSWSIKGGRAFMQVRRKDDDSLEHRFVYPFDDLLPNETITMIRTRWGASQVEKLADQLNITQEQL